MQAVEVFSDTSSSGESVRPSFFFPSARDILTSDEKSDFYDFSYYEKKNIYIYNYNLIKIFILKLKISKPKEKRKLCLVSNMKL